MLIDTKFQKWVESLSQNYKKAQIKAAIAGIEGVSDPVFSEEKDEQDSHTYTLHAEIRLLSLFAQHTFAHGI